MSIALTLVPLGAKLLELPAQFSIGSPGEGMVTLTSRFGCYWYSTLLHYDRYSCTGAFFDLIEWLEDYFLDLYLYFIF